MKNLKPNISKQISTEQIDEAFDKNYQSIMMKYYQLQFGWFHNAYNSFKDIDKYIILVHLVNRTLSVYNKHFYNLTYEEFYSNKSVEIEKISISDVVKELNLTKETARRKLNEMTKDGIIIRNKKNISIQHSAFIYQKPIASIKNFSNLLSVCTENLKINNSIKFFHPEHFEEKIRKNYTHYWNIFLNSQITYLLKIKDLFKNYENAMVFLVCLLNQAYNMKNANQQISGENTRKIHDSYTETITQYTLENSKGLNPTTISDLTGIPRASVIRKLNDLIKLQYIIQNQQNLYTTSTPKKGSAGFNRLTNFYVSNQPIIRSTVRDFLNFTII